MSNGIETDGEREEIEMLLPWYVTGRLDPAEAERVRAYLRRHPELDRQLRLAEEERATAVAVNEAVPMPSARALDRLLGEINRDPRTRAAAATRGLLERIREFFAAPSPGQLRWAAVAAAAVVLVQAVAIGTLVANRPDAYETASGGPAAAADGAFALVRFAEGATVRDITEALTALDMSIAEGPKVGGLFRIRIGPRTLDEAGRAARISALRERRDIVLLATPAP